MASTAFGSESDDALLNGISNATNFCIRRTSKKTNPLTAGLHTFEGSEIKIWMQLYLNRR